VRRAKTRVATLIGTREPTTTRSSASVIFCASLGRLPYHISGGSQIARETAHEQHFSDQKVQYF
jgi:hypothetical protein